MRYLFEGLALLKGTHAKSREVQAQLGVEPSRMKRELGGGRRLGGFRSRKSGVWRRPAALRGLELGSSPAAARRPSAARRKSRRPPVPARLDATPA